MCLIILLRRRKPEVVDLARGARYVEAHSLDGTYRGHPSETRLVADRLVEGPRIFPVEVIFPSFFARAEELDADVLEGREYRGQVHGRNRRRRVGLVSDPITLFAFASSTLI